MDASISTALSGLQGNTTAINIIGNDLANLNTTGYKASQIDFQDLMSQSLGVSGTAGQVGEGIGQVGAVVNYTQGSIQTTNGPTDAAIQGNGFFVVNDPNTNQTLYTRDGSFEVNSSGQLTTDSGQLVQGWNSVNGVINTNAPTTSLSLPVGSSVPPTPTTTMGLKLNLDSSAAVGATVTSPVQIYDSLGDSHDLTVTYTNTGAGTWSYAVTVPPADITGAPTAPVATGTLTFDANGNLTGPLPTSDPQTIAINNFSDGANNMTINWNLYNQTGPTPVGTITQYDSASTVTGTTQNGYAAGSVSGVALQNGGTVMATYTNGQQVAIGQLAVASIANPSSLSAVGDNNLAVTANTSIPVVGAANTGGRGQIQAGALESSTVDIATEFANLLTFERGYQADSRVITTSDQLDQETISLIPQA